MNRLAKAPAAATCLMLSILLLPLPAGGARLKKRILELVRRQQLICPQLGVRDVYKGLYQAAFGARHLLDDPVGARSYLLAELEDVKAASGPLLEAVSPDGRIVRVNLAAFKAFGLPADRLFAALSESARAMPARPRELSRWWRLFVELIQAGQLAFDSGEADAVAAEIAAGGPAPHHSDGYTAACHPHYRVMDRLVFLRHFPELRGASR